jgi:hypothetical protein
MVGHASNPNYLEVGDQEAQSSKGYAGENIRIVIHKQPKHGGTYPLCFPAVQEAVGKQMVAQDDLWPIV